MAGAAIGARTRRLTIQAAARTQDASGGESVTWSDVLTTWGHVESLRGREYVEAQGVGVDITHRVRIPYRAGVTSGHRLALSDGRMLDIKSVVNIDERNADLELVCVEHRN